MYGLGLGELLGELDGELDGLLDGEADGELEGLLEGESGSVDGLELGEEEGEELETATVLIICAARTKFAFSNMSISSMFSAAPSIRVFSSRTIPP